MEFKLRKVEKYGKEVWQHFIMDDLRKSQCMCLNCPTMKECEIAQALYQMCLDKGIALAVTRCPDFPESALIQGR